MTRGAMRLLAKLALLLAALPTLAQPGHAVRLQALGPEGAPVANAPVVCVLRPPLEEVRTSLPSESERSTTDSDGYCTIQLPESPPNQVDTYEVWIDGGNGCAGYVRVSPNEAAPAPLPVTLTKQLPLRGQVRAQDGTPVEGALIGPQWFPRTTTDAQGQFTLWGMGTSGGPLSIYKEGFAWTVVHNPGGEMDIFLEPGFRIELEAVDTSGKPVPGATIYSEGATRLTDQQGRAATLPRLRGTSVNIFAEYGEGEQRMVSERVNYKVSGEAGQLVRVVLTPYVEEPPVTISGRVVLADTGEPVRARIFSNYNDQDFDYGADEAGQTAEDGTFTITDRTRRHLYILARPTKSTLYGIDGIVRVDCSRGAVEGLELKVAPGRAVSGRIKLPDGTEPKPDWVILRQGANTSYSYSTNGHFQFSNLPPAPSDAVLESGGVTLPITLGAAGTALRDVTLNLPSPAVVDTALRDVTLNLPDPSAMVHLTGRLVNAQGEPQPGFSISLVIKSESAGSNTLSAETDGDGQFAIETNDSGMVSEDKVYYKRRVNAGGQNDYGELIQCSIVQPIAPFVVQPGETIEHLTIVAEKPLDRSIAGTIQDENGAPLKPEIQFLTGPWKSDSPREAPRDGSFKFYTLPAERFAISFELEGHQVRILEEGRNFQRGDQEIQVVLPTTPYPADVPLWSTITGAPWTAEAVEQSIQGDPIRRRFDEFKRLLNAASPADAPVPVVPAAPEPKSIAVRVVDLNGQPVTRISLRPAAHYGYLDTRQLPGPLDHIPAPGAATTLLSNAEGLYDLPLENLLWGDGTCRQWSGGAPRSGEASPRLITLTPEHRLTVHVNGHDGVPLAGISVAPYRKQLNPLVSGGSNSFPKTDTSGNLTYEGLPPGVYTLIAHEPSKLQRSQLFQADLTTMSEATVTVSYGPPVEGSDEAVLEELFVEWQKRPDQTDDKALKGLWERRSRRDRKRIQDAATARLAQPLLADIATLPFLAQLAVTAKMKKAVPDLMRHLPYFPENEAWQGAPAISNALADLAGNDVLPYFTQAMSPALDQRTRLAAIVAMNRIGTPESLAAWRALRDGARALPNAPQPQAEYTHGERMAESMVLLTGYLSGVMPSVPLSSYGAEVDADYVTGRIWMMNTNYVMHRYGDEWIPIEIGGTVMD